MVDSLLCEDVSASTLPTLLVQIADNLVQLSIDSPQSIDKGIPCHALLERLDFPWRVKSECFILPPYLYESSYYSLSEPSLDAVLKTDNSILWFLTFFSSTEILDFHPPCPLLLSLPELECTNYLEAFFPPFLLLRSLRTLSLSLLLISYHSFES